MKLFLFVCRHGDETILMEATRESWDHLRAYQDEDNRCTLEDIEGDYEGSFEEGYFHIDDGGHIDTIELTELQ